MHKRYAYTVWFTPRASCDKTCNTFGLKLLYLCKSTYFHIVNGRLDREFGDGVFTFACRQGASVINYVLARECDFANINMFSVHDFSEFSDHCPISFSLNCNVQLNDINSNSYFKYRWSDRLKWLSNGIDISDRESINNTLCEFTILYGMLPTHYLNAMYFVISRHSFQMNE